MCRVFGLFVMRQWLAFTAINGTDARSVPATATKRGAGLLRFVRQRVWTDHP